MSESIQIPGEDWPSLRVDDWVATRDTLHMWLQIVGKIRLVHSPMVNHWWQTTLYVTPRGLGTSSIPHRGGVFDLEFDFCEHNLGIRSSDGGSAAVPLTAQPVADFYARTLGALDELGIATQIQGAPNEVDPAIPFAQDREHDSYDAEAAHLFWRQLVQAQRVLQVFRADFLGKVGPVHFFWGAMDLACTRFSGRTAPPHPGGIPNCPDRVMTEAYSHELSSCGFWPGGGDEGARPRRIRRSPGATGCRSLFGGTGGVRAALRGGADRGRSRHRTAAVSAQHLRGRRPARCVGSGHARASTRRPVTRPSYRATGSVTKLGEAGFSSRCCGRSPLSTSIGPRGSERGTLAA